MLLSFRFHKIFVQPAVILAWPNPWQSNSEFKFDWQQKFLRERRKNGSLSLSFSNPEDSHFLLRSLFLLQFVWVCSLCKKKQELLKKTGQWYHGKPDELLSSPPRGEQGPDSPAGLTNGPSRGLNGRQQSLRNLPQLRRQMSHDPSQQQPQSLTQQQRQQSMRRRDTVEQDMPMSREDELRRQASMRRRGSVVENPPRDASRNRQGKIRCAARHSGA